MFQICAAIDVTAVREYKQKGKASYKRFVHENLRLITNVAFGGKEILNINLGYEHPDIRKLDNGMSPIEDVVYHAVRCGLYHNACLPENLKFSDEGVIGVDEGSLILPAALVYGLMVAVIVAPVNKDESSPKASVLNLGTFPIPTAKLWGRRAELLWLLDAEAEYRRLHEAMKMNEGSEGKAV